MDEYVRGFLMSQYRRSIAQYCRVRLSPLFVCSVDELAKICSSEICIKKILLKHIQHSESLCRLLFQCIIIGVPKYVFDTIVAKYSRMKRFSIDYTFDEKVTMYVIEVDVVYHTECVFNEKYSRESIMNSIRKYSIPIIRGNFAAIDFVRIW